MAIAELGRELNPKPVLNNILLIEPQNGIYTGFQGLVQTEPLGLEYVAGAVSDLVKDVRIHDDRIKPNGWRETIKQSPPDMVGIRCNYTADVPIVKSLVKQLRHEFGKEIPIVIGGHHISLRPQDLFIPEVNAIAVGPGEKPMQDMVKSWSEKHSFETVPNIWYQDKDGRFISNVPTRKISPAFIYNSEEMNERPEPRRDLVDEFRDGYYFLYYPSPYSIETARGCRMRCTFCSVWNFHDGKYKAESSSRTVQEILSLGDKAKYVNLVDDLAFSDIESAEQTADELIRLEINKRYWAQIRADNVWPRDPEKRKKHQAVFEKLAKAGLDMVLIGLESFDPEDLKRVNKGSTVEQNIRAIKFLKEIGISSGDEKPVKIWGAEIIFPDWTVADFDNAIKTNNAYSVECPQFTILTPLPGTPDYEKAKRTGQLTTEDPGMYDFFHWVIPTVLPPEEMYRQIARLYRETGPFANRQMAKAQMESMRKDIEEGRTTREAIKAFAARFKDVQDEGKHIAHLAQSALSVGGSKERVVFEAKRPQKT